MDILINSTKDTPPKLIRGMPEIYNNSISRFTTLVNNGLYLHLIALLELKVIQAKYKHSFLSNTSNKWWHITDLCERTKLSCSVHALNLKLPGTIDEIGL